MEFINALDIRTEPVLPYNKIIFLSINGMQINPDDIINVDLNSYGKSIIYLKLNTDYISIANKLNNIDVPIVVRFSNDSDKFLQLNINSSYDHFIVEIGIIGLAFYTLSENSFSITEVANV